MSPPERQHERCCISTFEANMVGVACYLVFVAGSMCRVCELLVCGLGVGTRLGTVLALQQRSRIVGSGHVYMCVGVCVFPAIGQVCLWLCVLVGVRSGHV